MPQPLMQALSAHTHLVDCCEANVQHVVVGDDVRHAVAGEQHQPVVWLEGVGVDERLSADEGLRRLERKVTQRPDGG